MKFKPANFAVLGQLAFRPWSAYELIQEMNRNFHYFYPRAESGLYDALKKLESFGYASAEVETKGKKDRTVYSITPLGREALKAWLDSPPSPYWLEFDGLLRVFLSKFGTPEALKASLEQVRADNNVLLDLAEKVANEYLSGTAPAQSEIVQRACVFDFLQHYALMYRDWLNRMELYLKAVEGMTGEEAERFAREWIEGGAAKSAK